MSSPTLTVPRSLGRQLNFAAAAGNAVCNRLLEPHGLTLAQWAVLSTIWRNGDLSLKDVAGLTGNAPPATSRIVDRMVGQDLLVRKPDPDDRRGILIGLGIRGENLRHLKEIYAEVNAVLLDELSPEEQDLLFDLLRRVETRGRDWVAGSQG